MRRNLSAIAVMVSLATAAQGGLGNYYFLIGDHDSKVIDGREAIRWPFNPKPHPIYTIPIKVKLGMYVEFCWPDEIIEDENDIDIVPDPNNVRVERDINRKIVLRQVLCSDIGRSNNDWPCYLDCVDINIRANFPVKLETVLVEGSSIISKWEAFFDGTDTIIGSGQYEKVRVCVKAWKVKQYNTPAGEREVGTLLITAKPDI